MFAMSMVAIMAAAGLAFDIGRFYSEKRFLQNAADAGALAVANALIRGETTRRRRSRGTRRPDAQPPRSARPGRPAWSRRRPNTSPATRARPTTSRAASSSPAATVRVAIQSDVGYTFGRVVGLGTNRIGGRARVKTVGDLLPIAVRHYINAPGPFAGAVAPCDGNTNQFQDLVATAEHVLPRQRIRRLAAPDADAGIAFNASTPDDDPVNHGPIIALVGQGASPSNASSFRGFVALDIRNFQYAAPPSNVFYNGVTAARTRTRSRRWRPAGSRPAIRARLPARHDAARPERPGRIIDGNSSGIIIDAHQRPLRPRAPRSSPPSTPARS